MFPNKSQPEAQTHIAEADNLRGRLRTFLTSRRFEAFITAIIAINAVTLGMETSSTIMGAIGPFLIVFDKLVLGIFVVEILLKLFAFGGRFFRSGWNWFDLVIVGISLMPASGALSVLRALRILRVLRLISVVPALRRVVGALVEALPGMGSIIVLMGLVFYVFAVMSTKLFGGTFPEWFGSVGASAYSLFQIMTLESWSMGIVRPVMETFSWAWAFF
ncbi:MAG: ion transporter, partial [Pseudomonadota bacterium]